MRGTQKLKEKYDKQKKAANRFIQNKGNNWLRNEELFNGVVQSTLMTRSNLHVPKVFEGVNTVSARLGKLPVVDFDTKPEGDENASDLMKGLWDYDTRVSDLDYLAELSKTEAGLYGRAVFKFIPSNSGARFELLDTMSFRVDPLCPADVTKARYCGQDFIYKTISQIEDEADEFGYEPSAIRKLKQVKTETLVTNTEEASRQNQRLSYLGFQNQNDLGSPVVRLTEWYTEEAGKKYIQTWANDEILLRHNEIKELGLEDWPYESWAVFPRNITFWVPSIADIIRDPELALSTILNQIIDNNTYRNFGMIFADSSSSVKNIIPRPLGVTPVVTGGRSITDTVWKYAPEPITNGMETFQLVNTLLESAAGIGFRSPGARGKTPVSQLAKEQALLEEVVGRMKMSYLHCFKKLGQRYANFIKKSMTTPRTVKIFGQQQITIENVKRDNFKDVDFISRVTPQETIQDNKAIKQKARLELFDRLKDDQQINQVALKRLLVKEADLTLAEQQELFEVPQQQAQAQQMQQQQQQPGNPQIPQNAEQPQLSMIQQMAQSQVPNTIRR